VLNIDVMDESGEHSSATFSQNIIKTRLDLSGNVIQTGEAASKLFI
jgi:hypothetical protein